MGFMLVAIRDGTGLAVVAISASSSQQLHARTAAAAAVSNDTAAPGPGGSLRQVTPPAPVAPVERVHAQARGATVLFAPALKQPPRAAERVAPGPPPYQ